MAVADVMPLFDDRSLPARIVVGGDFNIHTHSNDPTERRRAGPMAAVEALGLVNLVRAAKGRGLLHEGDRANAERCPCDGSDCYHVRTHRHGKHLQGAMADERLLVCNPPLAAALTSLEVRNGDGDVA